MKSAWFQKNFITVLIIDILLLAAAFYCAHLIRFDMDIPPHRFELFYKSLPLVLVVQLLFFFYFDLYRGMWRYTSVSDVLNILKASSVATLSVVFILLLDNRFEGFSRSVFVINWLLVMFSVAGFRLMVRFYFERAAGHGSFLQVLRAFFSRGGGSGTAPAKNLLIIGAGDAAETMYREISGNTHLNCRVAGFIDDSPVKIGKKIHGVPVWGPISEVGWIAEKLRADELLIAIPSAKGMQMRRIVEYCKQTGRRYRTLPNLGELIDGRLSVNIIREVDYRDLLGREEVRLDKKKIGAYLEDQCVLVTGAGGSIGSELCRQICRYGPKTLVLFERSETLLYETERDIAERFGAVAVIPVLGDTQNMDQVCRTFDIWRPNTVFHAAAYKHVPLLEVQPWMPVQNNILGTRNLVEAAKKYDVSRFVFVSTDKAVRPTSAMGASKRVAEMLIQNQNLAALGGHPRFVSVRFGNVVGSSGSVIPLFKEQIRRGGPVTVTHPDVTRYFMLIPEACQLILQAGAMGRGGEIFILEMGNPVRIADMAKDLIRMSGLEPDSDIKIVFTGLRPGEKLYEELITQGEGVVPTTHEKILVLRSNTCDMNVLMQKLKLLEDAAVMQDADGIRMILRELVADYHIPDSVGQIPEKAIM